MRIPVDVQSSHFFTTFLVAAAHSGNAPGTDVRRSARQAPSSRGNARGRGGWTVVVTGGTGFVGTAILRHLVGSKNFRRIVVIDLRFPDPTALNRVKGVDYVLGDVSDVTAAAAANLAAVFNGADLVIHTAGVVALYDDPFLLHNAHVVATRNVLRACREASVRALLVTSSSGAVTTPYTPSSQLELPSDFVCPEGFIHPSHYSATKYRAERDALAAASPTLAVCALRMPGVYGVQVRLLSTARDYFCSYSTASVTSTSSCIVSLSHTRPLG